MGKGKGKTGKKEDKAKIRSARREKLAVLPKPPKPLKKEKIKKVKKPNLNPPGPAAFPIPMGRPKPFTKSPQHAKWPSLFKKHLGVIEAHIRSLDRVMQSMKSEMGEMEQKEREEWELGERGNWRTICEMMDRAREVLASAREAAKGILPSRSLKDKKGLGVAGTNFEPLGPQLAARAAARGLNNGDESQPGVDKDGDTEMSDSSSDDSDSSDPSSNSNSDTSSSSSSDSDSESDAAIEKSFVPLPVDNKKKRKASEGNDSDEKLVTVEPNPYFVVDTNPTPVQINSLEAEKPKKKAKKESKRSKAAEVSSTIVQEEPVPILAPIAPSDDSNVDFAAVEAQLHAEVQAGLAKQQEAAEAAEESNGDKKDKKKRKRNSLGVGIEEVVEKKAKKDKKRKDKVVVDETEDVVEEPIIEKAEKKSKKDKKRKGEEVVEEMSATTEEGSKKKKRKSSKAEA